MVLGNRAEETVEEKETDAEVAVHAALIIQRAMMDVVEPARVHEPGFEQRRPGHPEIPQMHAVVQITEHENGPEQQRGKSDALVSARNVEPQKNSPRRSQDQGGRNEPFKPAVSKRDAMVRGVFVFVRTERLAGAVDEEMMDKVTTAEQAEPIPVQHPIRPISQEPHDETEAGEAQ